MTTEPLTEAEIARFEETSPARGWVTWGFALRLLATLRAERAQRDRLVEALRDSPIMSSYHGARGFEVERYVGDYDAWRISARAALAEIDAPPTPQAGGDR